MRELILNFFGLLIFVSFGTCNVLPEAVQSKNNDVEIESFMVFSKIIYRYAKTMIFCEMKNQNQLKSHEANFELTLPQTAFVSDFKMSIDSVSYESFIDERKMANSNYSDAMRNGRNAGILNQLESYTFNISISLAANATVLFYLEYEEEIPMISNGNHHYEYVVNILPKVAKAVKYFSVDVVIKEYKAFSLRSLNLCNKKSSCQDMNFETEATLFRNIRNNTENEIKIIWQPTSERINTFIDNGLLGMFHIEYEFNDKDDVNDILLRNGYFIHRFGSGALPKLHLHIIFVLDISDSMCEQRMTQLRSAMNKILNDMKTDDYFNIITFSTESNNWKPRNIHLQSSIPYVYQATSYTKEIAKSHIENLKCEGSTNIHAALTQALEIASLSKTSFVVKQASQNTTNISEDKIAQPIIFFLTDGTPTSGRVINGTEILKIVKANNVNKFPIYSLAFGNTADYSLLQKLSSQNNGTARVIYDHANADLQLYDFYEFVSTKPSHRDIHFQYTSPKFRISDVTEEKNSISDDEEITVTGRFQVDGNKKMDNMSHLQTHHGIEVISQPQFIIESSDMRFNARLCPCAKCPTNNKQEHNKTDTSNFQKMKDEKFLCSDKLNEDIFMERFWVYKTLQMLIKKTVQNENNTEIIREIMELSRKYKLVTPYTSLLILSPNNKTTYHNIDNIYEASAALTNKEEKRTLFPYPRPLSLLRKMMPLINYRDKDIQKSNRLSNMDWFNNTRSGFGNRDKIRNYGILPKAFGNFTTSGELCGSGEKSNEKCKHPVDCIGVHFISDIKVFIESYSCPLRENGKLHVGICCTK